ncbi:MAG: hypothetical protein C207_02654 [Bradyrhizobium sp. DFCI-1]|jgi:hypothetical protein|nr:MAG: hypothetical protein C207_02654 [Bradyrhizobium sp. DFCI-1]
MTANSQSSIGLIAEPPGTVSPSRGRAFGYAAPTGSAAGASGYASAVTNLSP